MRYLTLALCAAFASLILFFSQSMAQVVVPTKMNVELQDLSKEARKEVECLAQNMYFEAGQEPREGVLEFSSVDIQNDNYNSNPDPAFQNLAPGELYNKTHFTFISTFGPQLNVIDDLEK